MIFKSWFILLFTLIADRSFAGETLNKKWKSLYHLDLRAGKSFYFSATPEDTDLEIEKAKILFRSRQDWNTDLHYQCRFPARFEILNTFLDVPIPKSICPSYEKWIADLSPEGASIVFAGNYPDNPGSIFGHTFLKIKIQSSSRLQSGSTQSNAILDYALNYAANVNDELGFIYAIKGLLGAYQGFYSMDPYYIKVNEYSEGEGRDLWEYELNITPKESKFLLTHFGNFDIRPNSIIFSWTIIVLT